MTLYIDNLVDDTEMSVMIDDDRFVHMICYEDIHGYFLSYPSHTCVVGMDHNDCHNWRYNCDCDYCHDGYCLGGDCHLGCCYDDGTGCCFQPVIDYSFFPSR